MPLSSLSLPQRILAGIGCSVVLAGLAIGALLLLWERRARHDLARELAEAPAGWADSVRVAARVMLLPIAQYSGVRDAGRALVIRALMRQERGEVPGARADLAAAVGLGVQLVRHEPSYIGLMVGRTIAASGLHGWERFAVRADDTALAARAAALGAWARGRPGTYARYLLAEPDTAVAIARDTTLPPGARLLAVEQALSASLLRPRGLLVGPPRPVRRAIADLTRDADPNVARVAVVADATARRMNLFGIVGLIREWE